MSAAHAAIASHAGGEGNEDDEVYAVAQAVDDAGDGDVDDDDYDSVVMTGTKQKIEPLAALDHAAIQYDEFAKDFYEESAEIAKMSHAEVIHCTALMVMQSAILVSHPYPPASLCEGHACGAGPALKSCMRPHASRLHRAHAAPVSQSLLRPIRHACLALQTLCLPVSCAPSELPHVLVLNAVSC